MECEIFRILLKHIIDHLPVLFQFLRKYIKPLKELWNRKIFPKSFPKLLSFVLGCQNLWKIILFVKLEFSIGQLKRPQHMGRGSVAHSSEKPHIAKLRNS